MNIIDAAEVMVNLERMVAAVKGQEVPESKFTKALATLRTLSRKEGIPLAIVGGLAAIHHGYERFTKDIDVVVRSGNLDILTRVAPHYGIKVIWKDPEGWHKLQCEGVSIDVVPEGRKPRKDAPTAIPGPEQLGVREGAGYARDRRVDGNQARFVPRARPSRRCSSHQGDHSRRPEENPQAPGQSACDLSSAI